jgi:hypothetical protein
LYGVKQVRWSFDLRVLWKLSKFYTESLGEQDKSNTLVAAVQIAVMAEFGATLYGISWIVFEDTPFFAKDHTGDETFFLSTKQWGSKSSAENPTFSSGTVTVNDFYGNDAWLLGLPKFGKEETTGFIDRGKASFDVKSFESGHWKLRNCDGWRSERQTSAWEDAEKRGMAHG